MEIKRTFEIVRKSREYYGEELDIPNTKKEACDFTLTEWVRVEDIKNRITKFLGQKPVDDAYLECVSYSNFLMELSIELSQSQEPKCCNNIHKNKCNCMPTICMDCGKLLMWSEKYDRYLNCNHIKESQSNPRDRENLVSHLEGNDEVSSPDLVGGRKLENVKSTSGRDTLKSIMTIEAHIRSHVSSCCKAPLVVKGGVHKGTTYWRECSKCGKDCNPVKKESI